MDEPIDTAIKAIKSVLNIHENHLYPVDRVVFDQALNRLNILKNQGFK